MRQQEDSLPAVGRTHVGRSNTSPLDIEPQRGKVSENSSHCPVIQQTWDVLSAYVPGSNLPNDARHVGPQPGALAVDADSLAGHGEVLAREAANDDIHEATPWSAVEGSDVRPDRRRIQAFVFHARRKDAGRIQLPLDVAKGTGSVAQVLESVVDSEVEAADTGEQRQHVEGM